MRLTLVNNITEMFGSTNIKSILRVINNTRKKDINQ